MDFKYFSSFWMGPCNTEQFELSSLYNEEISNGKILQRNA
jgi:hypothetical protein